MPLKDSEAKLAYQREWYARKGNRERVIAKVRERKWTAYAGKCLNCGATTIGQSKGQPSLYCNKPACKSVQHKKNRELFVRLGREGREKQLTAQQKERRKVLRKKGVVSLTELADAY